MTKRCSKCGQEKLLGEFYRHPETRDGLFSRCKSCLGEYNRSWQRAHPEKVSAKTHRWQRRNPEKNSASTRRWKQANPEKIRESDRRYHKARYVSDLDFRLLKLCRSRVRIALRGKSKSKRTIELIGCSIEHLRLWLTFYFQSGMSWSNYGKWHIDHVRPCASFDLRDPEQQKQCFHYTNLQPLWAADNIRKGARQL